jgi:hypothetical protein
MLQDFGTTLFSYMAIVWQLSFPENTPDSFRVPPRPPVSIPNWSLKHD